MSGYEISEVKKAIVTSRRWMRKHANKSNSERLVVPEVPSDAIAFVIEYFLQNDGRREDPSELDESIVNSIKSINPSEVDHIMDCIDDLIDEIEDAFIDSDAILMICTSV